MEDKVINEFIKKLKLESGYRKFVQIDIIYQLINIFNGDYEKKSYPKKIENPLEIALQFYKCYNEKYYSMILDGINTKRIVIGQNNKKPFTDTENNVTFIRLYGNDGDIFLLVHEFAHFIDRNSEPNIIPNEYSILAEVFPFYFEKKLELWLESKEYEELITTRTANRIYYEAEMLKAIENELYYEELYKEKGIIEKKDILIEKIKTILPYDEPNLVNYLLRYPLANILSTYLINNNLIEFDNDLINKCLSINLYELLENYSIICQPNKNLKV